MIRESSDNGKRSSKNDMILCGILFLLIFSAGSISRLVRRIPAPFDGAAQILLFLGIVLLCLFIYKKLLCSYRYTLVYAGPDPEDLDPFGQPIPRPFPVGTLNVERMLGDKGRLLAQIPLSSIEALCPPGTPSAGKGRKQLFTVRGKSSACQLCYRLEGKDYEAYFSPSQALFEKLDALLKHEDL